MLHRTTKIIDQREANPKTEIAMTKLVFTAFAAAALAAPALAVTPMDFTWEGHKIVGTIDKVNDVQIIKGRDLSTRSTFELHVKNGFVRGDFDGVPVSYPVPKRKLAKATAD